METVHKIDPCVEIQIYLAARPGGAPSGGGSGQSPLPPPPQGQCNYPSGSYGARPDYQTGICRCKVCSKRLFHFQVQVRFVMWYISQKMVFLHVIGR